MTIAAEVILAIPEIKSVIISKVGRESYVTTIDRTTSHRSFLQHFAMWIWIGWIFFYIAFFLAAPILYYFFPSLLAAVAGLIIFSAVVPIDRNFQPKVCSYPH